jgi:hypothetical protein
MLATSLYLKTATLTDADRYATSGALHLASEDAIWLVGGND